MKSFDNVYINGTGRFLPNEPVSNDEIADYIQPISKISSRIQKSLAMAQARKYLRSSSYFFQVYLSTISRGGVEISCCWIEDVD